jgi:biotin carboxyl carrier protein
MKLQTQIAGQEYELTIERREERVRATIDGRAYELELRDLGNGEYLLLDGPQVHNVLLSRSTEQRDLFEVHLHGSSYRVKVIDPKRLRSGQTANSNNQGAARITASMPGKVVRVMVELGSDVEAGAGIVVVEAMKMQNEMKAPKAGTVISLSAVEGATVNAGDVLAVIE